MDQVDPSDLGIANGNVARHSFAMAWIKAEGTLTYVNTDQAIAVSVKRVPKAWRNSESLSGSKKKATHQVVAVFHRSPEGIADLLRDGEVVLFSGDPAETEERLDAIMTIIKGQVKRAS